MMGPALLTLYWLRIPYKIKKPRGRIHISGSLHPRENV